MSAEFDEAIVRLVDELTVLGDTRVPTARPGVAAEPPAASDVAVLMGEENAEAGEHWNIRPEPRPEAVPGTRQVVEAENV